MNLKQLVVGWVMVFLIAIAIAITIMILPYVRSDVGIRLFHFQYISILVVGGAVFFTLRDK
jgi:hypothetical protein